MAQAQVSAAADDYVPLCGRLKSAAGHAGSGRRIRGTLRRGGRWLQLLAGSLRSPMNEYGHGCTVAFVGGVKICFQDVVN